jgi:hypothetical protein
MAKIGPRNKRLQRRHFVGIPWSWADDDFERKKVRPKHLRLRVTLKNDCSIFLCHVQAVRRQGHDARECSGADGNHQQQADAKAACGRS